jgi:hypothetical protein
VNYRCPAGIVGVVDRLLRHNVRRVAKSIRASSIDAGGWSIDRSVDAVDATARARSAAPSHRAQCPVTWRSSPA